MSKQKNIFYKDPIDQWLERHPYLGTFLGFVLVWALVVMVITLSWGF